MGAPQRAHLPHHPESQASNPSTVNGQPPGTQKQPAPPPPPPTPDQPNRYPESKITPLDHLARQTT
eukprot:351219-Chlamydomonas_euryale.AAC.6